MSESSLHRSGFARCVEILKDALRQNQRDSVSVSTHRSAMAPQLAYGRHRGPVIGEVRRAAVLIALYFDPVQGWVAPLTLRPDDLEHHPGQISFPGGRIELNESEEEAARREFAEELGLVPRQAVIVGELSPIFVYASHHLVSPFVAVMPKPSLAWAPDPREVAEVIEFPLASLHQPSSKGRIRRVAKWNQPRPMTSDISEEVTEQETESLPVGQWSPENVTGRGAEHRELMFEAPAFRHGSHWIWGATAMMLHELGAALPSELLPLAESSSL